MSKYIKLDDAIEQVKTEFYGGGYQEWLEISIDNLINRIANLPTIEVMEYPQVDGITPTLVTPEISDDVISKKDAIKAYNEAVDELVKAEMEEFNLGDFTECSFNTTQLKLIARKIENIPSVIYKER